MYYSCETLCQTLLSSSIFLIVLYMLLSSSKLMICTGYKVLIALSSLLLIRMIFPYELPFAFKVFLPAEIATVSSFLQSKYMIKGWGTISIWDIALLIWLIGIVIKSIRFLSQSIQIRQFIKSHSIDITDLEPYNQILKTIQIKHTGKRELKAYIVPGISTPCVWYWHGPHILLPVHYSLTKEELTFVFNHEAEHYYHHDYIMKSIIQYVCLIYWWNPLCILMNKKIDTILEMRVDYHASLNQVDNSLDYREFLLHVFKLSQQHNEQYPSSDGIVAASIAMCPAQIKDLKKRITMLNKDNRSGIVKPFRIGLLAVAVSFLLLTYCININTLVIPDYITRNYTVLTAENSYIVKIDNNKYDVYYNDNYYLSTDSIQYFMYNIKQYNIKGERIK